MSLMIAPRPQSSDVSPFYDWPLPVSHRNPSLSAAQTDPKISQHRQPLGYFLLSDVLILCRSHFAALLPEKSINVDVKSLKHRVVHGRQALNILLQRCVAELAR